jgi:hypothetical protein
MVYGQLPFGIWGIAEPHQALTGLRAVKNAFQRVGAEYHRKLSVLPGSMVPLRSRSETAGTWAGVMTVADLILQPVHINWPHNDYCGKEGADHSVLDGALLGHRGDDLWLAFWSNLPQQEWSKN